MNPEYRRDWLLFAFILWFGLGVALERPLLLVASMMAIISANPPRWMRPRRRRAAEQVDDDAEVLEL